jgi:hypothetical protein
VDTILFGAGVGDSTDAIGFLEDNGEGLKQPTDGYFWIEKVQEYYHNGVININRDNN